MSETFTLPPAGDPGVKRAPTVYFIDDSATMREVIKIAFRKENIHVITCADAASALAQFEATPPDAVITDVIMPDQDGYSVCSQIKENPLYSATPVLLMSGVVNKSVADRAVAVKADELIRKPFQPQELIARVKAFLFPGEAPAAPPAHASAQAPHALSNLFAPPPAYAPPPPPTHASESAWPRALADAFSHAPAAAPPVHSAPSQRPASFPMPQRPTAPAGHEVQRLRSEIMRLEMLVKKLQTELQIEREYCQALEQHIHTLQESE
ncbi:MAG: response regulator [Acidobacteriia bacterium]|nr:response regulator [Terriglobia bacterium]